ncbi:hypothetical protein DI09_3p260 [Mitosporidium daphniae]|uniref:Uncharacterized protein n=1 Tax=Mitosporidium daphniae TaxID=1485682 RepID=A0A098VR11_9MICR|nr:uncharacterized protein DI09_3p260 [Mitosporidium daphniae]KGG51264.1 hypothetical protein DI09_3p260 [Mitosporidium daphniae]|eukprot:XP_013237691.1 uncharacterized protein DI09_3p260 [Mitosporidium daphniae]
MTNGFYRKDSNTHVRKSLVQMEMKKHHKRNKNDGSNNQIHGLSKSMNVNTMGYTCGPGVSDWIIWEAHMRTEEDIMIEISNSKKFKFVKFMVIIGEGH